MRLSKRDGPVGQGAGLIQAHHVHPGQALDRGKLLHQDPAPGERDRGHAEGDAGQQHQALRDHADQRRDRPAGDLPDVPMGGHPLITSSTATGPIAQVT